MGAMDASFSSVVNVLAKAGISLLVANEVRGAAVAAPVLYGMYEAGGTLMAIWLGVCSLAGIALSVAGPLFVARKFKLVCLSSAPVERVASSPKF
jgi:hypothetical protein